MLTINTKTKRFTLKGDEEQSERLFGLLVSFDIPCLSCGAPVPIRYNRKKNIYETIK